MESKVPYLRNKATTEGIYYAAIYMLQFPLGYLRIESIEEMGLPEWVQD
jgi:hypothetical protein